MQIPPVRYVTAGVPSREVEEIIRANSRTPDLVIGDLRGQVGCNRVGERRLEALFAKYGTDTVLALWEAICEKTEQRVRAEIAGWPDGTFQAEATTDNDGVDLDRPVTVRVRVEKHGDQILFDFTGSDDQTRGPGEHPVRRWCGPACYLRAQSLNRYRLPPNYGLAAP